MLIKPTQCVLFALILLALGSCFKLSAQTGDTSIRSDKYPFLRQDINLIDNNLQGLKHFYKQLDLLASGKKRSINIVHIGDSHIQADWFSGKVRKDLQEEFGSAGRGLVFPYRVARTNSPPDISSSSNVKWSAKRNIHSKGSLPIGISGITIQTNSSDFVLKLGVQGKENMFNKITLFTEKGPLNYNLKVSSNPEKSASATNSTFSKGDPFSREDAVYHKVLAGESLAIIANKYRVSIASLKELNNIKGSIIYADQKLLIKRTKIINGNSNQLPQSGYQDYGSISTDFKSSTQFVSTVYLPEAVNTVFLRGDKELSSQHEATIYGIVLENYESRGILYHMVGVNGAQFIHYNNSELFLEQLQVLKPDLIIVSLGANETANKWFNAGNFEKHLDKFVHSLKRNTPEASVLLTTPPDALLSRQYQNKHVMKARDILVNYAIKNSLAAWNFYDVMGGMESIRNWYSSGLAQRDHLHLTKAGYELQGTLLFEAIINGYGSYRSER